MAIPPAESSSLQDSSSTCQRCRQPLLLEPSISSLTPASQALITSALPSISQPSQLNPTAKLASLPPSSQEAARTWAEANGIPPPGPRGVADSFILLSDSTLLPHQQGHAGPSRPTLPVDSLSTNPLQLVNNLHALLSSRTPISHPLCTECTALLQSELQKQLEELSRERDAYIAFEKGIQRDRDELRRGRRKTDDDDGLGEYDIEGDEEEWAELVNRKKELEEEERKLKVVLAQREEELESVRTEEAMVKLEEEAVDKEEEEFLLSHHQLSAELAHLENSLHTAQTHLLLSESLLSHLESTNVYNDAFQIGHVPLHPASADPTGKSNITVGTINGVRLGGRPLVEWDEINAAWGLVALCLDRIAVKIGCTFETYKIVPLGSFSRIDELPPSKASYELYASSDLSPARILHNRRFNYALVAVLELLKQLVNFGKVRERGWGLGHVEIHTHRISGHSIRLPGLTSSMPSLGMGGMSIMGLSSSAPSKDDRDKNKGDEGSGEEQWTKACRQVLTVLKRILRVESEADRAVIGGSVPHEGEGTSRS